ncbi:MAG: hypothetical protein R6U65_00595 [Perlabentimonas sp.]
MELDSIIYIIIAIVLAIVNAVAQKKKKSERRAPLSPDKASSDESESTRIQSRDPLDFLFGDDEDEDSVETTYAQQETVEASEPEQPLESGYQKRMQEVAEQLLDKEDVEVGSYDYDDNVIAESAIGNALTEEEQDQARMEGKTDFLKEFDAKKAIIYSEVIKPKYFSVGVNS